MFEDRNFSWNYFFMTGNIHAYLLTKAQEQAEHMDEEEMRLHQEEEE
ncbi:YqzL-like protein [Alteribacillus persepolensis]|uniref:YqzL-like protein n=1 Tax=Alteribacillus persepolensis TaxID=568899 RepID=A0A1G8CRL7_9BACI|nr:YqzL family protein [Alteribacillus persepolensis]SDH47953.1 YqzL-like protein [Alteribacillus persepolensis]